MKSNWQILANISGYPKKYLVDHSVEKLIRPSDAIDAMNVVIERTKEETCLKRWQWLDQLCKETDSVIVVSSVWRDHFTIPEWNWFFRKMKLKYLFCIGVTETNKPYGEPKSATI